MVIVFMLPMTIVAFVEGRERLRLAKASESWPPVPAEITHSYFHDVSKSMHLEIHYTYAVDGATHTGWRIYVAGVLTRGYGRALAAMFPKGRKVEAYVDPADSSHATLLVGPQPGAYAQIWVPVGIWGVLALMVLTLWITREKPAGRRRRHK